MPPVNQRISFAVVMRCGLIFVFLLIITLKCLAQDNVAGIIFDKENKDRIASVNIRNTTTSFAVYNNLKGEFKIPAKKGDRLIFSRQNYHPDTITIKSGEALAIYMERIAIQLKQVTVHDTLLTPEMRLEANKRDFNKIYGSLAYSDMLSTPSYGGAGLSIDALWNAFSRSGRNAEHLRQIIQSDYEQNVIDYRFNKTFVGNITGLKDQRLASFMLRYRPGYYTTKTASEYEYIVMIKSNLRRFLRSSRVYTVPPLVGR